MLRRELMAPQRTTGLANLRRAIDCLPPRTRVAMLAGIESNTIVVGAYATVDGVCPMLAAHRAGGRTNFIAFAKAWDEYCFGGLRLRKRRARLATRREVSILHFHIEASLLAEQEPVDLAGAVAEHRALVAEHGPVATPLIPAAPEPVRRAEPGRKDPERVRPGDPDRSRELHRHGGWRWLRVVRSYDEYAELLSAADAEALLAAGTISDDGVAGQMTAREPVHAG
jgi:hypothetical protein